MKNEHRENNLFWVLFPSIISVIIALCLLYADSLKGENIMGAGEIAIVVAIIGVAGSILGAIFTMRSTHISIKRDGKEISEIRGQTSDMYPRVPRIESKVEKTYEEVKEILRIDRDSESGIRSLVEEMQVQKRLAQEHSRDVLPVNSMLVEIEKVYQKNAELTVKLQEYAQEKQTLTLENDRLKEKVSEQQKILQRFQQKSINKYEPDR